MLYNPYDNQYKIGPILSKNGDFPGSTSAILTLPKIICGTSSLGNLYEELPFSDKLILIKAYLECYPAGGIFDSAGKYGAGLALEVLGEALMQLDIGHDNILISNKLGWFRTPLKEKEPTFEKGVWKNLKHDAVQKISYEGIIECYEQGNQFLGPYRPQLASVHDPDEFLAAAQTEREKEERFQNIIGAYKALEELKSDKKVSYIGVGAKDWRIIQRISRQIELDWVMLANSLTIYQHPDELLEFIGELTQRKIRIINSAVFNGGFLVGSNYFNYRPVQETDAQDRKLLLWREAFFQLCKQFCLKPAHVCIQFGITIPGIDSLALNSTSASRIKQNMEMILSPIPSAFWVAMKEKGLMRKDYPYLG
ncbi:aldo/keto reductase [Chitinophaga tropicalis]|uniref:Aldo/keto reductase n=1 Tax=Chitinophaga tropicalis TaxID=2683588 RepID=A0A7K1U367_9BACT|nr:aldo/keto reductase [Chitinophaga tropicalis]MVT08798.1 aldo/keto reductase [Chitinophaga tropicalis]